MARAHGRTLSRLTGVLTLAMLTGFAMMGTANAGSDQRAKDSDHDGMPNAWESAHGLRVHQRDAKDDPDGDGLTNLAEFHQKTRPNQADTDKDGLTDGVEVHRFDTDPTSSDTDRDGLDDGSDDGNGDGLPDEGEDGDGRGLVGTILNFDPNDGVLTFAPMPDGYPTAAVVTSDTKIAFGGECVGTDATTANLVEGQDMIELRYVDYEPDEEFPPVRSILLDCPPPQDP